MMDRNVEVELREQMGDDFDLIEKMLNIVSGSMTSREKKELITELLEREADGRQGI